MWPSSHDPAASQTTAAEDALGALGDLLAQPERRWSDWKEIARRWAQLTRLQIASEQPLPEATEAACRRTRQSP